MSQRARLVAVASTIALITLSGPSSSGLASTVKRCGNYPHHATDGYQFPSVGNIRAKGIKCATARNIARGIRRAWGRNDFPSRIRVKGRTFKCAYREVSNPGVGPGVYVATTCRRGSDQRASMDLGS